MKNTQLINKVSGAFGRFGFQIKKHSPEILTTAGVLCTVGGMIMVGKATLKVNDVLDDAKTTVEKIHTSVERGKTPGGKDYNAEDAKKDLTFTYAQTGLKLAKLYAPAVGLGAVGIVSFLAANNVLRKRNVALAAAYATVDQAFKEYSGNVIERFGEKVDRELRYNIKAEEIEETVVDSKGKEKKVKKTVEVVDSSDILGSPYAVFFDESNPNWEKNPEYNKTFLITQQNYANDLLRVKKRVFLNEVLELLGFEPTKAGQVVGWKYDPENAVGDNYIDFGIFNINRKPNRDFVNGYERSILLDFNVDGNVWEDM